MAKSRTGPVDHDAALLLERIEDLVTLSYGHELSAEQRHELRASLTSQHAAIMRLRAYALDCHDEPALIYKAPVS